MAERHSTPTRICTACKIEKPATEEFFHAYKRAPDGRRSICRVCRAKEHAENRTDRLVKRREHYQANKERLKAVVRDYYQQNIEAQRAAGRARHHRNREDRLEQMREYRQANIDELLKRQRERNRRIFREKYKVDLHYTLKHRVSALLRSSLKHGRKSKRIQELLGFSIDELKTHIERQFTSGMTWEKLLSGEIHIDHIVPVAAFNITSDQSEDFRSCWSLPNLRPMWASENCSKQDKILTLI